MQNQFLILVALTPNKLLTPLRKVLQLASLNSLRRVKYDNFKVLLLGDEQKVEGNLHFVKAPEGKKGLRLAFALKYIEQEQIEFDYIARFDDDDILNPKICTLWASANEDCLADLHHAFYDLGSNRLITKKKTWLANTVFLKREHAYASMSDNRTLIEQDHAAEWQDYFKEKKIKYAKKDFPIYLRVLSPTSITANDNESDSYADYLSSFGNWNKPSKVEVYKQSLAELTNIHKEFFSEYQLEKSSSQSVFSKIKSFLNRG